MSVASKRELNADQIYAVLQSVFENIKFNAPLHVIAHLGFDPWMTHHLLSKLNESDKDAHKRAIKSFLQFHKQFPDYKLPRALVAKNMSIKTMRTYGSTLAFCLTFGINVTSKLNKDQDKCNAMFSIPLKQNTDTTTCIYQYFEHCIIDRYPNCDLAQVRNSLNQLWDSGTSRQNNLSEKIKQLEMKVKDKVAHSLNLNLFTILPNIIWRYRTPSHVPTKKGPDNDFSNVINKSAHLHTVKEEKSDELETDDPDNISTDLQSHHSSLEEGMSANMSIDNMSLGSVGDGDAKTDFPEYVASYQTIPLYAGYLCSFLV